MSKKISYLVCGHAHEHATRTIPEINLKDNSLDYAAVTKWIHRRYEWNCSQYTLLQAASTSNRFEVFVEYSPPGQQWNGLSFMPLRIRSFTGHSDKQSSRGHAYLTVVPPWDRHGRKAGGARADRPINIAVDVEMLIQLGCRLYAPGDGEALVTEDWITNKVLIYAYDAEHTRYIWSNRMYVSLRRRYQDSIKTFREEVQRGVQGTPVIESFMANVDRECKLYCKQWAPTACRDMTRPQNWECDQGEGRL